MKWQIASKELISIGSALGIVGFFSIIFMLSGMSHTDSGDSYQYDCDRGICADAYINVSTTYWNYEFEHLSPSQYIYLPTDLRDFDGKLKRYKVSDLNFTPVLYKKATYGHKLWANLDAINMIVDTQPNIGVEWLVPARGKDNWRPVKEGDTWDRGIINKIKLLAYNIPKNTIVKWSFILGDLDIDPFWFPNDNISEREYSYTYTNKTIEVTKYHMVNESYQVPIYVNETDEVCCNPLNNTCFTCSVANGTCVDNECKDWTHQVIDHYDIEWHMVNESYQEEEQVPDNISSQITGVTVCDDYYSSSYTGGMFFYNNTLSDMVIPPGDRNWLQYPTCRDYELVKGTCVETKFVGGCDE